MNQVNLVNTKSAVGASATKVVLKPASAKASVPTPRITDLAAEPRPPVTAKPSPLGPKPTVLSPKPADVSRGRHSLSKHNSVAKVGSPISSPSLVSSVVSSMPPPSAAVSSQPDPDSDDTVDKEDGVKTISKTALDNIRSESTSVRFNFDSENRNSSPGTQHKQIGVIRPQVKSPVSAAATSEPQPEEVQSQTKTREGQIRAEKGRSC